MPFEASNDAHKQHSQAGNPGFWEPVIVNSDMTIIGGHQRVTVLQDLGYDEIDCIVIEIEKTKSVR